MSLVNKMLRDLDARRGGDGEQASLPPAVTPLAAQREVQGGRLISGALLAATLVAAAAWYVTRANTDEPVVTPPTAVKPQPPKPAPAPVPATPEAGPPALRMADELAMLPLRPLTAPAKAAPIATKAPAQLAKSDVASPQPAAAAAKAPPPPAESRIDKQVRLPSAAERAEAGYRRGVAAQRQGEAETAATSYRAALEEYPEHAAARQSLAALLIEARQFDEAEEVLRKGTDLAPVRLASSLAWARLKVERNQAPAALEILQRNSSSGERSAEYQGFTAALLNRAGRAAEAVEHYQAATRLAPNEGRWWAGLGIALDAAGKAPEAREAYLKARALPGLPADLAQHVEQRLR